MFGVLSNTPKIVHQFTVHIKRSVKQFQLLFSMNWSHEYYGLSWVLRNYFMLLKPRKLMIMRPLLHQNCDNYSKRLKKKSFLVIIYIWLLMVIFTVQIILVTFHVSRISKILPNLIFHTKQKCWVKNKAIIIFIKAKQLKLFINIFLALSVSF